MNLNNRPGRAPHNRGFWGHAHRATTLFHALWIAGLAAAQTLVSSGGGTGTIPGGSVSWSVGEPVIGTGTVPGALVTQGYQQPGTVKLRLNIAAFLEGPYNATTGLMNDALRGLGTFPLTEPFTALGYTHVSGGGETTSAPVLQVTGDDAIVDWLLVELRSTVNSANVLESRSALLQRDGDVVGTNGVSPVSFTQPVGSYHVAVRHRNHLGVMTLNPLALSNTPAIVDLTQVSTATYGTAARKSITGAFPAQVLWSGDVTFNGQVVYVGAGNDRDPILVTVGSTTPNNVLSNQYNTRDVDLDGEVRYVGAGNDRDPILVNVGSTTPNNVRVQQLP